jgi:SAM-dependent methyltransferase
MAEKALARTGWRARARKVIRRSWMKYAMKGVAGTDAYDRLERAYALEDPWNLDSELEMSRFEWTNKVIQDHFGAPDSVLEIGCGEGHQTGYLQGLCRNMYGLDVSARAIDRARRRLPAAQFAVADLAHQPWGNDRGRFDLVTACEVLYYVSDIDATLDRMSHLGKHCLVTVFAPAAPRVWGALRQRIADRRDWHCFDRTVWVAGWWSND